MPVSESEDLKVTEILNPRPSERDVDGRRGVLRWDLDMAAGDEARIATGYDMVWPEGQTIGHR